MLLLVARSNYIESEFFKKFSVTLKCSRETRDFVCQFVVLLCLHQVWPGPQKMLDCIIETVPVWPKNNTRRQVVEDNLAQKKWMQTEMSKNWSDLIMVSFFKEWFII